MSKTTVCLPSLSLVKCFKVIRLFVVSAFDHFSYFIFAPSAVDAGDNNQVGVYAL